MLFQDFNGDNPNHVNSKKRKRDDFIEPISQKKTTLQSTSVADNLDIEKIIDVFNKDWKKCINFLIENSIVENNPQSIANFLIAHKARLDFSQLGECLGDAAQKETLHFYINQMPLKGMSFTSALRLVMLDFAFPGEAQKIDRIMEAFGNSYYTSNQDTQNFEFLHQDAAYVLAFSCVMLNTDAHNPSIKRKMSFEQFKRNNKGINKGQNFTDSFLREIYDDITQNEIKRHQPFSQENPKSSPPSWLSTVNAYFSSVLFYFPSFNYSSSTNEEANLAPSSSKLR